MKTSGLTRVTFRRFSLLMFAVLAVCEGRADRWESRATGPAARTGNSAVWTGSEMIVWGGGRQSQWLGDGARYNLTNDTWLPLSSSNAPSGRWFHVAVWTGTEMIVWGGRANFAHDHNFNDGGIYNPQTDTWRPMTTSNAPTARAQFMAVWTGTEMLVWGGSADGMYELDTGGRYNPVTDTWTPMSTSNAPPPRMQPTAVWTGEEMIVFGGVTIDEEWISKNTGGRYNPATDTWTPLPTLNAPDVADQVAVWTGTDMIVWGGRKLPEYTMTSYGARYNLASNEWTPLSTNGAPSGRMEPAAVWTGTELIVWCGGNHQGLQNDGARYNPVADAWTAMTDENAPIKRWMWRPDLGIWTGEGMLVYGGSPYPNPELDTTDYYVPYAPEPPPTPPSIFQQPTNTLAVEGDATRFIVRVGGTKPHSYQWYFGSEPIAGAQSSTLDIYPVSRSHEGDYSVVVSNVAGVVTSAVARLTVQRARVVELVGATPQQEGTTVTLPLRLLSEGDVGGMDFTLSYDTTFLKHVDFQWEPRLSQSFRTVNTDEPGQIHVSIALPGTAFRSGTQDIAEVTFLLRSVPETLETEFSLEVQDLSGPDGNTLDAYRVATPTLEILSRKFVGDNNANDRLDVGDASVVLRYLSRLEPARRWDVPLNDVNSNGGMDSGDAIRILRASAGIDPQPELPAAGIAASSLAEATTIEAVGRLDLLPGFIQSTPGQTVTVQIRVSDLTVPVSGAAFCLNYDTNALRVISTSSYQTGSLVPETALPIWNLQPGINDVAVQSGSLRLAVSSATAWSGSAGVLAQVTFHVQPGATNRYVWPLTLTHVEITEDGYANHTPGTTASALTVRLPAPGRLSAPQWSNDSFTLTLHGEPGATYIVEASSDLEHWSPVGTILSTDTPSILTDIASQPMAFFRVRTGP